MNDIIDLDNGKNLLSGRNLTTKEIYIVRSELLIEKSKTPAVFVATRCDETAWAVKIQCFDITANNSKIVAQIENTTLYKDAIEIAKKDSQLLVMTIPWHNIKSIKIMRFNSEK